LEPIADRELKSGEDVTAVQGPGLVEIVASSCGVMVAIVAPRFGIAPGNEPSSIILRVATPGQGDCRATPLLKSRAGY